MHNIRFYTISDRNYDDVLKAADERILSVSWPRFVLDLPEELSGGKFGQLMDTFPEYMLYLLAEDDKTMIAACASIPIFWDGTLDGLPEGWGAALKSGFERIVTPNTLCALSITVAPEFKGQHMGQQALLFMKQVAQRNNLRFMIAPVRPSLKSQYPLTPIDRYILWQTKQGEAFDPWQRIHQRLGATVLKTCPNSMRIVGGVEDWETAAEMRFPESGEYIVNGALTPIHIDLSINQGWYIEPNVWMQHPL